MRKFVIFLPFIVNIFSSILSVYTSYIYRVSIIHLFDILILEMSTQHALRLSEEKKCDRKKLTGLFTK